MVPGPALSYAKRGNVYGRMHRREILCETSRETFWVRIVESIASGQSPVFRRWMGLSPMVFHMMDSAMPLLALGELEELVSDTQRGGGVEFARLALEHLRFLPVADDVGAVEGTVVLDPQRAVLIDADRGMIARCGTRRILDLLGLGAFGTSMDGLRPSSVLLSMTMVWPVASLCRMYIFRGALDTHAKATTRR